MYALALTPDSIALQYSFYSFIQHFSAVMQSIDSLLSFASVFNRNHFVILVPIQCSLLFNKNQITCDSDLPIIFRLFSFAIVKLHGHDFFVTFNCYLMVIVSFNHFAIKQYIYTLSSRWISHTYSYSLAHSLLAIIL